MKNVLIVFLILIIVAMAGYFLLNNNKTADKDLLSYSYSDGALSFKYPSNYDILEKTDAVAIVTKGENPTMVAQIGIVYFPGYISKVVSSRNVDIEDISSETFKMVKLNQKENSNEGSSRIVYLDDREDPSSVILFTLVPNAAGLSEEQADTIFSSFIIDKEKSIEFAQKSIRDAKDRASESLSLSGLANIRSTAEVLFDLNRSYANVCNPVGSSQGEKFLMEIYQSIEKNLGKENLSCMSKVDSYSVSIKLEKSNVIRCIDSSGYSGIVSGLVKSYSCR